MAGTQVQRRRGTTAEHATFTGAVGELTVDLNKKTVVVHDGVTPGGNPLPTKTAPQFVGGMTVVGGLTVDGDVAVSGGMTVDESPVLTDATFPVSTRVLQDSPTGAASMPSGTTAERPAAASNGMVRYNSETKRFEGRAGDKWITLPSSYWESQPIGMPIPIWDHIAGVAVPPTDDPVYRYVKLSASDAYNTGVLTSESVSGAAPLVIANAVINLTGSPLNGHPVHLINTERRVLRGGSSGTIEADAFQGHAHTYNAPVSGPFAGGSGGLQSAPTTLTSSAPVSDGTNGSPRVANETRAKSIGATYYMRIL